jgi:hypothetical protein
LGLFDVGKRNATAASEAAARIRSHISSDTRKPGDRNVVKLIGFDKSHTRIGTIWSLPAALLLTELGASDLVLRL